MRRRLIVTLGLVAQIVAPRAVRAAPPPTALTVRVEVATAPTIVELDLSGDGWDPHLREEVRADLTSELARDDIRLGSGDEGPATTATIQIRVTPGDIARIEIRVRDELTDKTVLRELSLAQTPPEARSLEIAVAAEELLQASWAELMLTPRTTAPLPTTPPPSVAASLRSRTPAPSPRDPAPGPPPGEDSGRVDHVVAAEATVMGSTGGLVWLGGLGSYEVWPIRRLGVGMAVGAMGLVPVSDDAGRVNGVGGLGRVELFGRAVDRSCCRLDIHAAARGMVVRLRGRPTSGYEGRDSRHALGELGIGLRPAFRAGPVWVFGRAGIWVTPGGVHVRADDRTLASHAGLGVSGSVGVAWPIRGAFRRE